MHNRSDHVRWRRLPRPRHRARWAVLIGVGIVVAAVGLLIFARERAERIALETAAIAEWTGAQSASARAERIGRWCDEASGERIDSIVEQYPEWSDAVLAHIACRRVVPGMRAEHVVASWGRPTGIQSSQSRFRPDELWFYGPSVTVLFWDGRVKSTQEF